MDLWKGKGNKCNLYTKIYHGAQLRNAERLINLLYNDYTKASDRDKHTKIMGILQELNIDGKHMRIIGNK